MAKKKAPKAKKKKPTPFTVRVKKLAAASPRERRLNSEVAQLLDEHRDGGGRFKAGNPGGPGNPMAARANQLRAIFMESADPDTIRKSWIRAQVEAAAGSIEHMRLVFSIVMPKNVQIDVNVKHEFEQRLAMVVRGAQSSMVEEAQAAEVKINELMEQASAVGQHNPVQRAALPG